MPAQPKREEEVPAPPQPSNTSAFKKEKKAKLKSGSQKCVRIPRVEFGWLVFVHEAFFCIVFFSAKNWNSLFLGVNSVMDVMAEKYNVSKTQILEADGTKQSAAVRVALGETQIVNETRDFLISHGVKLDAFSQVSRDHHTISSWWLSSSPSGSSLDCLIAWFIGSIDCLIEGLIEWSIDWSIDWLIDWLVDWLIDWLLLWLIDWLIVRATQPCFLIVKHKISCRAVQYGVKR